MKAKQSEIIKSIRSIADDIESGKVLCTDISMNRDVERDFKQEGNVDSLWKLFKPSPEYRIVLTLTERDKMKFCTCKGSSSVTPEECPRHGINTPFNLAKRR